MKDLLTDPIWEKSDLGLPLPDSRHAVSVALPTWNDVIDYEEKKPECINSLKSIYPRFGLNPLVKKITQQIQTSTKLKDHNIWPYPNEYLALKAKSFCDQKTDSRNSKVVNNHNMTFLLTQNNACKYARSFWQHTGLGLSSREAAINLGIEITPSQSLVSYSFSKVINRISKFTNTSPDFIHLTSSGMSALYTALEIIYKVFPNKPTVQIGFPYVDVLKLPMKIFHGSNLITEEYCDDLEHEIKKLDPAALIIELPSNPMLRCVDVKKIARIASKLKIPIITDDTIGCNININSLENSDIVFTSLTKIFSGSGDILAGSLILNPKSKWIDKFVKALDEINVPKLSDGDLVSLEKASKDVHNRVIKHNKACLKLKKRLENHKFIKNIFHPEYCPNFNSILRKDGGYGCLLSFELKGGLKKAKQFYDSLRITKGPSLGTKFSLVCPYVQLAHYNELQWAESFGVPSNLIRVSVGMEDQEHLWEIFSDALDS